MGRVRETEVAISVRRAEPGDRDRLVEFQRALARESEGRELELASLRAGVEAVLCRPLEEEVGVATYWVAEEGRELVGCLMTTREWSDWRNGWFWWIQSVYVTTPHRRRGVFRALHAHVLERARERADVCGLRLYVEAGNEVAQHAYARLGLHRTNYLLLERALQSRVVPPEETR